MRHRSVDLVRSIHNPNPIIMDHNLINPTFSKASNTPPTTLTRISNNSNGSSSNNILLLLPRVTLNATWVYLDLSNPIHSLRNTPCILPWSRGRLITLQILNLCSPSQVAHPPRPCTIHDILHGVLLANNRNMECLSSSSNQNNNNSNNNSGLNSAVSTTKGHRRVEQMPTKRRRGITKTTII